MKKIVRVLVLAFCICMLATARDSTNAAESIVIGGVDIGYAVGDYFTKNGKSCATSAFSDGTCHGHGICIANTDSRCNCLRYWPSYNKCQIDLQGTQCLGFARYCQWRLYGFHDANASNKFENISGKVSANTCTGDVIKQKLNNCAPATHIRTGDGGHSMIVVSTNDSSIQIVACNTKVNGVKVCKIYSKNYTWSDFASYLKGRDGILYANAIKRTVPAQPGSSTISTSSLSVYVDTKVNFSWTASSNTTKYNLKYFDSANNYVTIATITGTSYEYIFTKPGQYGVYVDSLNDNGQYAQSNVLWIEVKEKAHEHNWAYRYYHSAHPHHNSYICTTCNAEKDDMNSSNFSNVCDTCLDGVMKKRVRLKGHTYDLYMASTTWEKAKEFCQKKGGHLVTITEAAEAETVYSLTGGAYCWLGGYRVEDTRWRWITGENFAFSDWSQNEPNNYGGNENYIGTSVTNKWNDYPNSDQAVVGFVCEYEPIVIAFDMNGGQGGMAPILKGYDESVNLYEYAPTRAGYKFAGWSRDKGAQLGQYWYGSLCDVNESITLYAIWEKSHITVAYDATNKILYQKCVLDGVNKNRNLAEVILYTSDYGTTSMTNEYGTEVSVDSSGKVIDKVYGVGSAKIPKGGFVVSAHASQDNVFVWDCIDVGDYIYYDAAEQSIYVFAEQEKMTNFKHCKVNGHTEAKMPAKSPTTKKVGLTEGVKCANCGIVLKKQMTIAKIKAPKATTIKTCSSSKKTITVKFKKCSNIAGYKIQLATQKNMKKGVKTYNVQKNKSKYVIRKLKRNKKYYVRIRTFKKVNGKKIYSKWSKKVMVKTR